MGFLLFILFVVFVLVPLGKIAWRIWSMQRQWKNATRNAREAYRRAAEQAAAQNPVPRKKKIDPSVGEYVAFEEIACNVSSTTSTESSTTTRTVHVESRYEDAVWEEIE